MMGAAIQARRVRFGFSVEEVAELSGLPPDRVREIEQDGPRTVYEMETLGDALAFDPARLHRGEDLEDPMGSAARFRAPEGVREMPAADARLLARAAELGQVGAHLLDRLGEPPSCIHELRKVRGLDSTTEPWREGYELGKAARLRIAPDPRPLPSMQALLEGLGVHVAFVRFEANGIHAASIREPGGMPVVLLNVRAKRVQWALSRRAILAHELCHLLHDGGERDLLTVVSRLRAGIPLEQRAGGFAPNFIAPDAWVQVTKQTPRAIVREIALEWGFSYEGAAWHARTLRFISEKQARALAGDRGPDETSFEGAVVRLPLPDLVLRVEASQLSDGLVSELAVRCQRRDLITPGRAREILRFR